MKTDEILAITMVHGCDFLDKWIDHYGGQLGRNNLLIISHGDSPGHQFIPSDINRIVLPRVLRSSFEQDRIKMINELLNGLLCVYKKVIFTDVDELIIVNPLIGVSLKDYLLHNQEEIVAPIGFQLIPAEGNESINWGRSLIEQADLAIFDEKFCKPSIRSVPCRQGIGGHALFERSFHLDGGLLLFHLKYLDAGNLNRYKKIKSDIKNMYGSPEFFGQWLVAERSFFQYRGWARSLERVEFSEEFNFDGLGEVNRVPQPPTRYRVRAKKSPFALILSEVFKKII